MIHQFRKYNLINSEHHENNFGIFSIVFYKKKVTSAVDKIAQQ